MFVKDFILLSPQMCVNPEKHTVLVSFQEEKYVNQGCLFEICTSLLLFKKEVKSPQCVRDKNTRGVKEHMNVFSYFFSSHI